MTEFALDFIAGAFRDFLGLHFEIVDASNLSRNNCVFLTSGATRLMLCIATDDSPGDQHHDSLNIELFGSQISLYYRVFEDSVQTISSNLISEAARFSQLQSMQISTSSSASQVKQIGFELPDATEMENHERGRLIAQRLNCSFIRLPVYCGRMLDGSVMRSDEDTRGRARYVQFSPYGTLEREQVVVALNGLVTISPEWASGREAISEVFFHDNQRKGLLLSRRF